MRKKIQLNSQSENGGEEPTIVDDVFKEGLQNTDCLAILLMCLRNSKSYVNSIF